ncbi:MAG: MBL fold metallo-hydrolase [Opitutales bacterium]|nr:MBL fold metallo-hydrolase [Opitutales bacterium]MCH8540798.1 MBL fold metallo-hydrolase [Opitutales bacterium]
MKVLDLNRDGGIGANCLSLEIGPFHIVVDAGLHPKKAGREAMPDFSKIDGKAIDFFILTHCHLDHLGALPVILREHPESPVLMSIPSTTLAPRMLHNSCNVMKRQGKEQDIAEYPLFTHGEIDFLQAQFKGMPYGHTQHFTKGEEEILITFYSAGHVVGAGAVLLEYKHRKIFLTGDVLFHRQRILNAADFPEDTFDTVILETTRGETPGDPNLTREGEVKRLLETVNHTLIHGGSVLIPVFALGRMQEILTLIRDAQASGDLIKSPVFCSGLGMDLANYFDAIHRKTGLVDFQRKVLKDLNLRPLPRKLKPGQNPGESGLYVVSSGMLVENTPSYTVASCVLGNSHNTICYVGYCDPDTPGGKMLAQDSNTDFIFEKLDLVVPMKARVERFELSGHADREEIFDFTLKAQPRAVVLTHGDPAARDWFAGAFREARPEIKVFDPTPGKVYTV